MSAIAANQAAGALALLLSQVGALAQTCLVEAQDCDRTGAFPIESLARLAEAGVLACVVPTPLGGLGIGTEPDRAEAAAALLMAIGGANIALGRIFEAHLNAIRLIMRYGAEPQRRIAARDAQDGALFALWVTDDAHGVRFQSTAEGLRLQGQKLFCSAARHATRAVITAADTAGDRFLMVVPLGRGEQVRDLPAGLQGVRGAGTGSLDFSGVLVDAGAVMGTPAAYLEPPEFAVGAWRASAVAAGGLAALVEAARTELVARGRAHSAEQRERFGRMMIHAQAARLWVRHVAPIAEDADRQAEFAEATVNLARIAIETACLETIMLVQRSLGLSAFLQGNPVERMTRDLATYLRQPAPDEALRDAAAYFACSPVWGGA